MTEQYGALGFGAVLIDQQHGLLDERTAFEAVSRLEKFPACFPIIRVCDNTTALISRALDAGAPGILAPMINNAEVRDTSVLYTCTVTVHLFDNLLCTPVLLCDKWFCTPVLWCDNWSCTHLYCILIGSSLHL